MSVDDVVKLIQGIGFPGAIAFFVLWRLEGAMLKVRDEINSLRRDQARRNGDGNETNRSQP